MKGISAKCAYLCKKAKNSANNNFINRLSKDDISAEEFSMTRTVPQRCDGRRSAPVQIRSEGKRKISDCANGIPGSIKSTKASENIHFMPAIRCSRTRTERDISFI